MKYRGFASDLEENNATITLEEFFMEIRDNPKFVDPHWLPLTKMKCEICQVSYDYVIKLENAGEELKFVYQMVNGEEMPIELPMPKDQFGEKRKWESLTTVPFTLINETLYKIYQDDYKAFNYNFPTEQFFNSKIQNKKNSK